ncbi:MAG: hypothetical protein A2Y07_02515 [Planctomycetes bacterium GWF2_50_10]|nr:MAG: hypothetical protein A2Y07_02515 [Planctomycetes bacterium GWF2_50_10]
MLDYPSTGEITFEMRDELHPLFAALPDGISEFTFANIYLFRATHQYRIGRLGGSAKFIITGEDNGAKFFMLPFGLPQKDVLDALFKEYRTLKCVSMSQSMSLSLLGYYINEDRDNYDYLYPRAQLAFLEGRDLHKLRNRVNKFTREHRCEPKFLLDECAGEAIEILEKWQTEHGDSGDYVAAKEALEKMGELQLCGGIFYVEGKPVGYTLGEELELGRSFVIHFQKAIETEKYKGLYQYITNSFAIILPEKYETVNLEQDLGEPGLRRAKESYYPTEFVKKFKAFVEL